MERGNGGKDTRDAAPRDAGRARNRGRGEAAPRTAGNGTSARDADAAMHVGFGHTRAYIKVTPYFTLRPSFER